MQAAAHLRRLAPLALVSSLVFSDVRLDASSGELEFEYAGCARVRPGRVCELGSEREIVLWSAGSEPVQVNGVNASASDVRESTSVEGGVRVRIHVPESERVLQLRSGGKRALLHVSESSEPVKLRELGRLWKAGQWERVRASLAQNDISLEGSERDRLRALQARLALRSNENERAADELEATAESARRAGLLLEASNDVAAAAYCRAVRLRQYERARRLLADAHDLEQVPENRARLAYYSAVVANASGDLLSALEQFRNASVLARRLGLVSDELFARQELAVTLNQLHRHTEALAEQKEIVARELDGPSCLLSQRWEKLAWLLLTQPEPQLQEAGAALDRAERLLADCPDPLSVRNHRLNRVELALQLGDANAMRGHLQALGADTSAGSTQLAAWEARYWGELHLVQGENSEAARLFERAEQLADSLDLKTVVYLARLGRARALARQNEPTIDAAAAYWAAEDAGDALVRWAPFGQGQQLTALQTRQSSRDLLSLLLSQGRHAEALKAATRAARRVSALNWQTTRVRNLSPTLRQRWERAVADYRARRQQLERVASEDWKLSQDGLLAVQLSRALEKQQLDNALAAANALFASPEPAFSPRAGHDAHLLISDARDGWWAFLWTGETLHVRSVLPISSGRAAASQEFGAGLARVLEPFLGELNVPLLRVTLPPEFAEVDVHALEVAGTPLIERVAVAYTLEPGRSKDPDGADAVSRSSVLVLGDPNGDLPWAKTEASRVASRFAQARLLLHDQIKPDAFASQLANTGLLHFAGHGRSGGIDGINGALLLGSDRVLSLGDVLALERAPDFVVLSACSSSVSPEPGAGLSIGQAFIWAGARAVVGASRAISDRSSERFATVLYDQLLNSDARGVLPTNSHVWARAVRAAMLALKHSDASADWASIRLLLP
ncbi:MAG: CHAT domain-containing protein [Myxococcota bacterium]